MTYSRTIRLAAALLLSWVAGCSGPSGHAGVHSNFLHSHDLEDAGPDADSEPSSPGPSAIAVENRLPGTRDYLLQNQANAHEVEGYASTTSAAAGERVDLFVNVAKKQAVHWDLYRIGYYQGLGARAIASGGPVTVAPQPACPVDPTLGTIECRWARSFQLTIDPDWLSGYYVIKLTTQDGFDNYILLVLRETQRRAPLLVQASVTTWQAYNPWGGTSLYKNYLPKAVFALAHADKVSFDRPYDDPTPWLGEGMLVRWLEREGYDVAYITNLDVDRDPELLKERRAFVSVFHDEYWSVTERDAMEAARDAGVSLVFLSANTGYWRVRFEPSSTGTEHRLMTCYKSAGADPVSNAVDTTTLFREKPFARPENALLGVMWTDPDNSGFPGYPFVVTNAKHWIYAGTGVHDHDTLGNVVGREWDSVVDNGLAPAGLEIVSGSPAITESGTNAISSQATFYYPTPQSLVFAAGTIDWSLGLDGDAADPRIQLMTENLLRRAGVMPLTATQLTPQPRTDDVVPGTSRVVAGGGRAGYLDGPALTHALFHAPSAVAAGPNGELYVAEADNRLVRKIAPDGKVSTVAGCPPLHAAPRHTSCFRVPAGIAVDGNGVVYVSDAGLGEIFAIATDGTVSSFASGSSGGDGSDRQHAGLKSPRGLAVGSRGELYVADLRNEVIRRIDQNGVTTIAANRPELAGVSAVAVGPNDKLYFTASRSTQIGMIDLANGNALSVLANVAAVPGNQGGPGATARLRPLEGLAVDADGLVFSDTGNNRIRRMAFDTAHTITTLLGGDTNGSAIGDTRSTQLVLPRGLTAYQGGYAVADSGNQRVVWWKSENAAR